MGTQPPRGDERDAAGGSERAPLRLSRRRRGFRVASTAAGAPARFVWGWPLLLGVVGVLGVVGFFAWRRLGGANQLSEAASRTAEARVRLPLHPQTREPAVAAYYRNRERSRVPEGHEDSWERHPVTLALWSDGTLIWSRTGDRRAGHPYLSARLDPEQRHALADGLRALLLGREGKRTQDIGAVDTTVDRICLREDERVWRMSAFGIDSEGEPSLSGTLPARAQPNAPFARPEESEEERALDDFWDAWRCANQLLLSAIPPSGEELTTTSFEYEAIGAWPR